jgi:hypothetical protein
VLAVYCYVLAVGPTVLKFGRQPTVTSLGLTDIGLLSRVDATDGRSISLFLIQSSIPYVFGKCRLPDNKTQPISENSVENPDCRGCTSASPDEMADAIRTGRMDTREDRGPILSTAHLFRCSTLSAARRRARPVHSFGSTRRGQPSLSRQRSEIGCTCSGRFESRMPRLSFPSSRGCSAFPFNESEIPNLVNLVTRSMGD